jgi:DNA repair exonuclease SbcCD ATPase subunit
MSEEVNKEFDELLDDVMGGENLSPDTESAEDKSLEAKENAAPEAEDAFVPYEEDEFPADDSAPDDGAEKKTDGTPEKTDSVPEDKAPAPDAEKIALQEKITNYEKRLHDTQSAMHKANEERARLQKELDALKNKKADTSDSGDDDNWFKDDSDSGDEKTAELESKIDALEEKQKQYQQEQAVNQWRAEADKIAASHEDFNSLVYEKLEPMLDETTGDPAVLAAYMRWQDKSPAGAYEFAKKVFGIEEKLNAKPAPPEETGTEARTEVDPTRGKAGLDRMNSADFAESKRSHTNMIDEVFG